VKVGLAKTPKGILLQLRQNSWNEDSWFSPLVLENVTAAQAA
jgi:hypothetical protein